MSSSLLGSLITRSTDGRQIEHDQRCHECDYNLRGLKVGGRCPECGAPIPPAHAEELPLSRMPLPVIRVFRRGAWLATSSVMGLAAAMIAGAAGWLRPPLLPVLFLAATTLWTMATWLLTPAMPGREAESRGFSRRGVIRHLARGGQIGWIVFAAALVVRASFNVTNATSLSLLHFAESLGAVTGIVGLIMLAILMERLAEWTRDHTAVTAFQWFQWLLPLAILAALLLPFGGLWIMAVRLIAMVSILLFPVGMLLLTKSITLAAVHSREHRARETRRLIRQRRDAAKLSARLAAIDRAAIDSSAKASDRANG